MNIQRYSQSHRRRLWGGYTGKVLALDPIAYWPLWETQGSVAQCLINPAQNGAYTGVTLNQPGIGDGYGCPYFDGANDFVNVYSAALNSAFDGSEGSLVIWCKVAGSSVWTDGAPRYIARIMAANSNNHLYISKGAPNNRIDWLYKANGILQAMNRTGMTTTDWFHAAMTWSATADEVRFYYDGVQEGATGTGLGAWAGDPTIAFLGLHSIGNYYWHGYLAHAVLFPGALTASQIAGLAEV